MSHQVNAWRLLFRATPIKSHPLIVRRPCNLTRFIESIFSDSAFYASQRRDQVKTKPFPRLSDESNVATIRRPTGRIIAVGAVRQLEQRFIADLFDVNIEVVTIFPIQAKAIWLPSGEKDG
jgi:hypothetical protein